MIDRRFQVRYLKQVSDYPAWYTYTSEVTGSDRMGSMKTAERAAARVGEDGGVLSVCVKRWTGHDWIIARWYDRVGNELVRDETREGA